MTSDFPPRIQFKFPKTLTADKHLLLVPNNGPCMQPDGGEHTLIVPHFRVNFPISLMSTPAFPRSSRRRIIAGSLIFGS